jgi:hypothetical protein
LAKDGLRVDACLSGPDFFKQANSIMDFDGWNKKTKNKHSFNQQFYIPPPIGGSKFVQKYTIKAPFLPRISMPICQSFCK